MHSPILTRLVSLLTCTFLLWPVGAGADNPGRTAVSGSRRPGPQASGEIGDLYNEANFPGKDAPEGHGGNFASHQIYKDRLRRTGDALDVMQKKFEEFGSITMSSLILSRPNARFSFELYLPTTQLFTDARDNSEGAASAQLAIATITGVGVAAQVDLDRLALAKVQLRNFEMADKAYLRQKDLDRELKRDQLQRVEEQYSLDYKNVGLKRERAAEDYRLARERADAQLKTDRDTAAKARTTAAADAKARDAISRREFDQEVKEAHFQADQANRETERKFKEAEAAIPSTDTATVKADKLKAAQDARTTALEKAAHERATAITTATNKREDAEKASDQTRLADLTRADVAEQAAVKKNEGDHVTAKKTYEDTLATADQDLIKARQSRDLARNELNPPLTEPKRPSTEGEGNVPELDDTIAPRPDALIAELKKLREQTGLLPANTTLKLPNRAAIQQAAGDSATLNLLNFLGNPGESAQFEDKVLLYGVTNVGVNPGWRSRKDFAATLTTQTTFEYETARPQVAYYVAHSADFPLSVRAVANAQLTPSWRAPDVPVTVYAIPENYLASEESGLSPLVAGITPMSDSQTLDLQDDYRRQDAIALQLALALRQVGAEGQSKAFHQFARQQQKNAATRSSGGTVNTFSSLGGLFGFQVGPRLKALGDPASRSGGSANVLDRQSFPALLFFGIDRVDLEPKVRIKKQGNGVIDGKAGGKRSAAVSYELVEPVMSLTATNRWNPLKNRTFAWEHWYNPLAWKRPRFSEGARMDMMIENADAANGVKNLGNLPLTAGDESYAGIIGATKARRTALYAMVNGSNVTHRLPLEVLIPQQDNAPQVTLPQVSSVVPEIVAVTMRDQTNAQTGFTADMVLLGENLDMVNDVQVEVGKAVARVVGHEARHSGALVVKVAISAASEFFMLRLTLDPQRTNLTSSSRSLALLSPPIFLTKGALVSEAASTAGYKPAESANRPQPDAPTTDTPEDDQPPAKAKKPAADKTKPAPAGDAEGAKKISLPLFPETVVIPRAIPVRRTASLPPARSGKAKAPPSSTLDLDADDLPLPK